MLHALSTRVKLPSPSDGAPPKRPRSDAEAPLLGPRVSPGCRDGATTKRGSQCYTQGALALVAEVADGGIVGIGAPALAGPGQAHPVAIDGNRPGRVCPTGWDIVPLHPLRAAIGTVLDGQEVEGRTLRRARAEARGPPAQLRRAFGQLLCRRTGPDNSRSYKKKAPPVQREPSLRLVSRSGLNRRRARLDYGA
jgi:hypothetical protein